MSFLRTDSDPHARFRALISQRLDEPLTVAEMRELRSHLLRCARCRGVDRDFRAQRVLLRRPAPSLPPRDLWARTSAALDREVARHPRAGVSREPFEWRGGSPRVAAASVVGLMLAVAVIGNQLWSGGGAVPSAPGTAVGPTPFEVPTQELTFVGHDTNGFAIYRTDVSQMCPSQSIDCTTITSRNRQVVRLRGEQPDQELRPNSVAFHPNGNKVAIAAGDDRGEAVYVVFLKPVPHRGIDDVTVETARPAIVPSAATPTVALVASTRAPATDALVTAAPVITPASRPTATPRVRPTRTPAGNGAASPTATARPATPRPSPSSSGVGSSPQPTGTPPARASAGPVEEQLIQPILEGVLPTGADPAWSPDGDTLAFSAMPADRSRGSDIYVWRNGEQHAEQLTDDHRSYFASWAGARIVTSRAPRSLGTDGVLPADSRVSTVVIDLRTGEQRHVEQPGLWLPAVDPTGRFAVVWRGELRQVGPGLEPAVGALYLADWRRLDPFAADPPATRPDDHSSATGDDEDAATRGIPTIGPGRLATSAPDAATASEATRASSDPTARPMPTAEALGDAQAVEPDRLVERDPVLDWQVRWNDDGDAFGFWIAETPGESWGRLAIIEVDGTTGRTVAGDALLGPTLAKRVFSLGQDRVVWVAPVEDQPEGELRIRTWGPNGTGTLRIRDVDAGEGVPGF